MDPRQVKRMEFSDNAMRDEITTLRAELAAARAEIARLSRAMWLMACESKEMQADLRDQGGYFLGAEMLRADAVAMRAALDGGSPSAC